MAVGTMDFVDAAARGSVRAPVRDTARANAATARARFDRDLDAATARNAAERGRNADAVADGRADHARDAERVSAGAKAAADAKAAVLTMGGIVPKSVIGTTAAIDTKAPAVARDGSAKPSQAVPGVPAQPADTVSLRGDPVASARDVAQSRPMAQPPEETSAASSDTIASAEKPDPAKDAPMSEGALPADPKGDQIALATPTIALVLGASLQTSAGGPAKPTTTASGTAAVDPSPAGPGGAQVAAGPGLAEIAGRGAPVEGTKGDDDAAGGDSATGAAFKTDLLAALSDGAPTATLTPDAIVKAPSSTSGPAPAVADKPAAQALAPPVPLGQVPMTIGLRSLSGSSEFQIRLDPLELGRVDVTLDIDKDKGTATTHLVVERVETLAMLQRDAGSLQQALAQAGLDASRGDITMSLRSDGGSGGETAQREGRTSRGGPLPGTPSEAAVAEVAPLRVLRGLSGVDIRI